eukprot:3122283-Rhodomonas_salina.1
MVVATVSTASLASTASNAVRSCLETLAYPSATLSKLATATVVVVRLAIANALVGLRALSATSAWMEWSAR